MHGRKNDMERNTGKYPDQWVGLVEVKYINDDGISIESAVIKHLDKTKGELVFPNMHIVANSELNTSYNLILSATMFDGLIYEINMKTHRLSISVPDEETLVRNLRVIDSGGSIHILCN